MAVNVIGALLGHKAGIGTEGVTQVLGISNDIPAYMLCVVLVSLFGLAAAVSAMVYAVDRNYKARRA